MNMYVGNLPFNITEEDLRTAFSAFGEVASVNVVTDRNTGRPKGFGFVDMPDNSEADKAIKALNGTEMKGASIKISQAKPRSTRSPRRSR